MLNLLITIFLGPFGVHKFLQKKKKLGFLYLFTFGLFGFGWIIDIFLACKNLKANKCTSFTVAGTKYHQDNIKKIMDINPDYNQSDKYLFSKYPNKSYIYKYKFKRTNAHLKPEPKNPHDPNAIMVMVENNLIGYVPADLCLKLKKRHKTHASVSIEISGGEYKTRLNEQTEQPLYAKNTCLLNATVYL